MSEAAVRAAALAYLRNHQVMTLATAGVEGVWATAVFYVNDGFNLYFLSAGHTRHGQNMGTRAHIAAAIQEDYRDWGAIQGIQLEGEVVMLAGDERATAVAFYTSKFPFIAQADAAMRAALAKVNWYCLRPSRLYFIDNSKGLGHRDEVNLADQSG
ncbi:MAG TPA: pyridoxamine 5'-phosphate oxidase family protein [Chloroflexota bacterium]|nr:pyridoxamine 5'-phosphate oxidase family protein [Chloroflexota bacterium]HUM71271.1 pyridoxamine 5'-phosphate oxidase family protein [Chloroflexota bacterium]